MNRHIGRYRFGWGLKGILVVTLFLTGMSPLIYAATFNVPAGDVNALIAAINAANDESTNPGADTIVLAGGTYYVNLENNNTDGPNGLPSIISTITIQGNGAIIERVGGSPSFRIFHVARVGSLILESVTIRYGSSAQGGAIYNAGTVVLNNSTLYNNSASSKGGGIINYGTATINNSTLLGNSVTTDCPWYGAGTTFGGGIYNAGTAIINNSALNGNSADGCGSGGSGSGGGIFNDNAATIRINNSTISANRVWDPSGYGAGIYNAGVAIIRNSTISTNNAELHSSRAACGGGIYNSGTVTLTNSTISSNSSDQYGGGIFNTGNATLNNSTLSSNSASTGGAIYREAGTVMLKNTIVANSPSGGNCRGDLLSLGYNISSDTTCNLAQTTDQTNTDPLLGLLQNNGGPTTTHALLPGSPALDRIPPAACVDLFGDPVATDQRGVSRPQGANCDIGAFEREQFSLMVTKAGTGSGTVTSDPPGITCGTDCEQGYDPNTAVTLTAAPNPGSVFAGWSGDSDCSDGRVTMDTNKTCTATFNLRTGTIVIVKDTQPDDPRDFTFTASGGLNPSLFKLDDDSDPTLPNSRTFSNIPEGTYTVIESAASGFELTNLSCNDPDGGSTWDLDNATVTIDLDMGETVTCTFTNKKLFMLAVTKAGLGSGTVTSDPAGINCGSDCSESYPFGTNVTLLATPNAGSIFAGWGGDPDCADGQVTMDAHKACIAIFNLQPLQFTLTVTKDGDGSGTVVSNPVGIDCGTDCTEIYNEGAIVNLIATPDPGSVFAGWGGDPDCTDGQVTMNANKTCIATFNSAPICQGVTATSSPQRVTFRRANQQATIRVTIRNNSGAARTVTAITPQAGEPFTITKISPSLPRTINNRSSRVFTVTVRGPAGGPFPVVATQPYFDTALDCGVLTTATEPQLLVPLRVENIQAELQGDHVLVEARGEGIASVQLQLFDLNGKQLLNQASNTTTLALPTMDSSGQPLANGVYLYVVRVRGYDGQEYVSEVRKLVILR